MRFKEYLIREDTKRPLNEEIISGGLLKVFKRLEYWFDFGGERTVEERIHRLEEDVINAGGPGKFAMVVRRIPSVKHFLHKHAADLVGDLAKTERLV